jgi:hypothetical protein
MAVESTFGTRQPEIITIEDSDEEDEVFERDENHEEDDRDFPVSSERRNENTTSTSSSRFDRDLNTALWRSLRDQEERKRKAAESKECPRDAKMARVTPDGDAQSMEDETVPTQANSTEPKTLAPKQETPLLGEEIKKAVPVSPAPNLPRTPDSSNQPEQLERTSAGMSPGVSLVNQIYDFFKAEPAAFGNNKDELEIEIEEENEDEDEDDEEGTKESVASREASDEDPLTTDPPSTPDSNQTEQLGKLSTGMSLGALFDQTYDLLKAEPAAFGNNKDDLDTEEENEDDEEGTKESVASRESSEEDPPAPNLPSTPDCNPPEQLGKTSAGMSPGVSVVNQLYDFFKSEPTVSNNKKEELETEEGAEDDEEGNESVAREASGEDPPRPLQSTPDIPSDDEDSEEKVEVEEDECVLDRSLTIFDAPPKTRKLTVARVLTTMFVIAATGFSMFVIADKHRTYSQMQALKFVPTYNKLQALKLDDQQELPTAEAQLD